MHTLHVLGTPIHTPADQRLMRQQRDRYLKRAHEEDKLLTGYGELCPRRLPKTLAKLSDLEKITIVNGGFGFERRKAWRRGRLSSSPHPEDPFNRRSSLYFTTYHYLGPCVHELWCTLMMDLASVKKLRVENVSWLAFLPRGHTDEAYGSRSWATRT